MSRNDTPHKPVKHNFRLSLPSNGKNMSKFYQTGGHHNETFEKCSILVKIKEGKNFNHRNILDISRIEI